MVHTQHRQPILVVEKFIAALTVTVEAARRQGQDKISFQRSIFNGQNERAQESCHDRNFRLMHDITTLSDVLQNWLSLRLAGRAGAFVRHIDRLPNICIQLALQPVFVRNLRLAVLYGSLAHGPGDEAAQPTRVRKRR